MERHSPELRHYQVIVVGAGPGGLQLGYFLGRAGVDYLILDRASGAGSFFEQFPVHRKLLSINKINTGIDDAHKNLRWDWNSLISDEMELTLKKYDQSYYPQAQSLVNYFRDYCRDFQLRVRYDCDVVNIGKHDGRFVLTTALQQELSCDILVVATGTPNQYVPKIPGIELAERYASHDRSIERCLDKDILILGKGNSSFETAEALLPHAARIHLISPEKLRMAWLSHFLGHVRQINSHFFETFTLKQQNAVLNGTVHSIERSGEKYVVSVAWTENGQRVKLSYDRVILCTGFKFDEAPFAGECKPEVLYDGKLPAMTGQWESVNVPGLFFCGSLMQANDYKKSASPFIHGIRYNARTLSRFLAARLNICELDTTFVPVDSEAVFAKIYERLRSASSLWHMHDSLCDAYVFDERNASFIEMQDMPVRMLAEHQEFRSSSRIEFRFTFSNPEDEVERQKFTNFGLLHPVLLIFVHGQLVGECHMYEDIYAEWEQDQFGFVFRQALQRYVSAVVA